VLESEGKFFRVSLSDFVSPPPQPLTPILFTTRFLPDQRLGQGQIETFEGVFDRVYIDGAGDIHPHLIEGFFSPAPLECLFVGIRKKPFALQLRRPF